MADLITTKFLPGENKILLPSGSHPGKDSFICHIKGTAAWDFQPLVFFKDSKLFYFYS